MKQEELYTQLNTTMPKSKVPVRSLREGIGRQDVPELTNQQLQDILLFGAQMLPGSDIAREIGASKLEPPIAEDVAEKKIIDPLLKGISTTGDVVLASAPLTGPGALGTAAVGATLKYGPKVFSALSEAVKKLKVKKAPGKDILNIISKTPGVKTDELKFTGLDKFLKDKKSVTKEEVDEYIQDSTVPIEEKVYGKVPNPPARFKKYTIDERGGENYREINFITKPKEGRFDQGHFPESNIFARVRVADRVDMEGKPTLHLEEVQSEYAAKSKGGKNVIPEGTEEKAIQLRNNIIDIEKEQIKIYDDLENKFDSETGFLKKISDKRLLKNEQDDLKPKLIELLDKGNFSEYNILRDRILKLTKKESDISGDIIKLENEFGGILSNNNRYTDLMMTKNKLQKELYKAEDQLNYLPPALPYATKDNWYKYPIRKMLRDAAERGLDSISMTTGKVQYNRYSSSPGRTFEESKDVMQTLDYVKKNIDNLIKIDSKVKTLRKLRDAKIKEEQNKYFIKTKDDTTLTNKQDEINIEAIEEKISKEFNKKINDIDDEIYNNKNIINTTIAEQYIDAFKKRKDFVDDQAKKGKYIDTDKKLVLKDEIEKLNRLFNVNPATRVGVQYDTKYKSYLDDLAKRYNTTVDKTRVDGDKVSNVESGGVVRGDKAEAYRLKITPEMRKEILEKGVVKFKTGGYIEERT